MKIRKSKRTENTSDWDERYTGPVTFAYDVPHHLDGKDLEVFDEGGPHPRRAWNLMNHVEAVRFLRLDASEIDHLHKFWPVGPGYFSVNGQAYYALSDLEDWKYTRWLNAKAGGAHE